ncbi:MAG TPA: hypothetical protein VL354_15440 [Spirochaetia bacterium]|nr:hypothetical protein [Spirochaetia bacterium]
MKKRRRCVGTGLLVVATSCFVTFFLQPASRATADGFRSITTVTADYYFPTSTTNETYYVETDEVFLAKIIPSLSLEAKVTRNDFPGGPQHLFYVGPVVSFTDTIYAVAIYGLGFDAQTNLIHEVDADFNWETDTSAAFVQFKGDYFTVDASWYILPSVGGKIHLIPPLGLFGEYFLSWDSAHMITGSFWGEADYTLNPIVAVRGGFTVSFSRNLGYSIIAGTDITITPDIVVKYKFSFLSNVVEYLTAPSPTTSYGIENLISLDWQF